MEKLPQKPVLRQFFQGACGMDLSASVSRLYRLLKHGVCHSAGDGSSGASAFHEYDEGQRVIFVIEESHKPGVIGIRGIQFRRSGFCADIEAREIASAVVVFHIALHHRFELAGRG